MSCPVGEYVLEFFLISCIVSGQTEAVGVSTVLFQTLYIHRGIETHAFYHQKLVWALDTMKNTGV